MVARTGGVPDIAGLRAALEAAEALPVRDRRKQARSLADMALRLEQTGALDSPEAIAPALRALAAGAGVHSYPQRLHMARARLMQARRDLAGLPEPVIAAEAAPDPLTDTPELML